MAHEPSQEEIDNFFDFGQATTSGELDTQPLPLSSAGQFDPAWTHGGVINVPGGLNVTENEVPTLPEDFYNITLPMLRTPVARCKYCEDLNLDCKIFANEGNKACFACVSLFRQCSFVEASDDAGGRIHTLHTVTEDASVEQGTLTGIRHFYTAGASIGQIKTELERRGRRWGETPASNSNTRFSKPIVRILKTWLQEHAEHPYPTNEQKEELCESTGLNGIQVSNWLANARRRGKVQPKRAGSPAPFARSQPVNMASTSAPQGYVSADYMTPIERWKNSPPEDEAPLAAIARAAASSEFETPEGRSSSSKSRTRRENRLSSGSEFSVFNANSTTSVSSCRSSDSIGSGNSHGSSRGSHSSYSSFARKDRRRRRRSTPLPSPNPGNTRNKNAAKKTTNEPRPFQCTFCVDTFKHKYDWLRHEKSLHLNFEKWICCPNGPIERIRLLDSPVCAYCYEADPTPEHIESHDHSTCVEKGLSGRSFTRKDHLRQHLRLVHNVKMNDAMESWKSVPEIVRSRCGFCEANFTTWEDRAAHLAKHFRDGKTMADWSGGWGFDPEVAANVADAMPPFLINTERSKPLPWSASQGENLRTYDHIGDEQLKGQCKGVAKGWQVLGAVLAEYVLQCRGRGEEITDEKLQAHARRCLFDCDDPWNQTSADNPHWLALFKGQVGLTSPHSGDPDPTATASMSLAHTELQSCPLFAADLEGQGAHALECGICSQDVPCVARPQNRCADMSQFLGGMDMAGTDVHGGLGLSTTEGPQMLETSGVGLGADNFGMEDLMWSMDDDDVLNQL